MRTAETVLNIIRKKGTCPLNEISYWRAFGAMKVASQVRWKAIGKVAVKRTRWSPILLQARFGEGQT